MDNKNNQDLNKLLASYQVYKNNLKGFHLNVVGGEFFELHEKFEEYYSTAEEITDELAEQILSEGGKAIHTLADYLELSFISEKKEVSNPTKTVENTVSDLKQIVEFQRELYLTLKEDKNHISSSKLLQSYIQSEEKVLWMLNNYLK